MMKSPSKLSTRSTPMRSPSSTISSFSSFYSVSPNVKTDILPTHCYVCTSSASHHAPVLQLCDCRVAMCESCAVERVCCTDEFTLDCSICGNKVAPSANGIIRNVDKVKDSIDGYLERSFRHFKLPVPAKGSTSFYAFQPLIAKFNKIENLAPFVREYYVSSSTALEYGESGEEAVDVDASVVARKKHSANMMKLKLARVEYLRDGELMSKLGVKTEIKAVGNITVPTADEEHFLPLGPLKYLRLTKDIFLEKLLLFSDPMKDSKEVINPCCVTCHDNIHEGESLLFSCDCDMLMCRCCAIKQFLSSKNTYRKGLSCPCCHVISMISFDNVEKAKEEELSIIETIVKQYSTAEKKYSSKSIGDLRKLLQQCSSSISFPSFIKDKLSSEAIHSLSFNQVQLELVRIYVYLERKKPKHGKIIMKSIDKKVSKKNKKEEDAYFDEEEMKSGKKAKKKKDDKDEMNEVVDPEEVKYYENKEDERYFFEDSEKDKGFDLPVGPLRLLHFKTNPYVELFLSHIYLSSSSMGLGSFSEKEEEAYGREEDKIEEGEEQRLFLDDKHFWDFNDHHRFDQFKPKHNTPCCKCSINPQNMDYIQMHLRTEHSITRRDEIEKFMKQIQITPVAGSEEKRSFISSESTDTDMDNSSLASLSREFVTKDLKFSSEVSDIVS
jgi:hypothetical protein